MATLNPGKFAHPEILGRMRRDLLLGWLEPARDYLRGRGLALPRVGDAQPVLCEALARVLLEPTPEMPPDLLESLHVFHELDHAAATDALRRAAREQGLELGEGPAATPLDVAMAAWLRDRQLVEEVHLRFELNRPRSFRYYSALQEPPPPFTGPAPEQVAWLEGRLSRFYEAWKRGRGVRVFVYPQEGEWWFLVRHGAPCRREGVMEGDQPGTVFFRPQCHDVVVYNPQRAELRLNCCAERERRVLLRAFGRCLFGRADFFPATAKYTLAPLVQLGRAALACGDVPGIERVTLKAVEFHYRRAPWRRELHEADDIFEQIEMGKIRWPGTVEEVTQARFEVRLQRGKRPRRLAIVPCNKALYTRDADSHFLERFVAARGFARSAGLGDRSREDS
jgi:hypothetical protein